MCIYHSIKERKEKDHITYNSFTFIFTMTLIVPKMNNSHKIASNKFMTMWYFQNVTKLLFFSFMLAVPFNTELLGPVLFPKI